MIGVLFFVLFAYFSAALLVFVGMVVTEVLEAQKLSLSALWYFVRVALAWPYMVIKWKK